MKKIQDIYKYIERDRDRERETETETERERQTDRQADGQTGRQTDRQIGRQIDNRRQSNKKQIKTLRHISIMARSERIQVLYLNGTSLSSHSLLF